ncbi:MAG: hypothetical protein ACI867_000926 [Glaciecola sp.]|jgi:hypothetical protein
MSLSDKEQRILQELETQLRAEDPALARRATKFAKGQTSPAALVRAGLLFTAGFVLLLLLTFHPLFGIVGAAVMLVALVQGARAFTSFAREQVAQARQKASRSDDA